MNGIMMKVWVPVTVPDVEVTCHSNCNSYVSDIATKSLQGCLIIVGVDIDNKVDILVVVKHYDVDVIVIDKVYTKYKL